MLELGKFCENQEECVRIEFVRISKIMQEKGKSVRIRKIFLELGRFCKNQEDFASNRKILFEL